MATHEDESFGELLLFQMRNISTEFRIFVEILDNADKDNYFLWEDEQAKSNAFIQSIQKLRAGCFDFVSLIEENLKNYSLCIHRVSFDGFNETLIQILRKRSQSIYLLIEEFVGDAVAIVQHKAPNRSLTAKKNQSFSGFVSDCLNVIDKIRTVNNPIEAAELECPSQSPDDFGDEFDKILNDLNTSLEKAPSEAIPVTGTQTPSDPIVGTNYAYEYDYDAYQPPVEPKVEKPVVEKAPEPTTQIHVVPGGVVPTITRKAASTMSIVAPPEAPLVILDNKMRSDTTPTAPAPAEANNFKKTRFVPSQRQSRGRFTIGSQQSMPNVHESPKQTPLQHSNTNPTLQPPPILTNRNDANIDQSGDEKKIELTPMGEVFSQMHEQIKNIYENKIKNTLTEQIKQSFIPELQINMQKITDETEDLTHFKILQQIQKFVHLLVRSTDEHTKEEIIEEYLKLEKVIKAEIKEKIVVPAPVTLSKEEIQKQNRAKAIEEIYKTEQFYLNILQKIIWVS